jgi:hypothetical protein
MHFSQTQPYSNIYPNLYPQHPAPSAPPQEWEAPNHVQQAAKPRFAELEMIPEAQWKRISRIVVKLNPNPKIVETYKTVLERIPFWGRDDKKIYKNHIAEAERIFDANRERDDVQSFDTQDLVHLNKALDLVESSERTPICFKTAQAYALRHIPGDALAEQIKGQSHKTLAALNEDLHHAQLSIVAAKEVIESHFSEMVKNQYLVSSAIADLLSRDTRVSKRRSSLEKIDASLTELNRGAAAEKQVAYNVLNYIEQESKDLAIIARQLNELQSQKADPAVVSLFKNHLGVLRDAYFLSATEHERVADLLLALNKNSPQVSFIRTKTAEEAALFAYRDYAVAKGLFDEELAENRHLQDSMKNQNFLKTGKWETSLSKTAEGSKLDKEQAHIEDRISELKDALKRVCTKVHSNPAQTHKGAQLLQVFGSQHGFAFPAQPALNPERPPVPNPLPQPAQTAAFSAVNSKSPEYYRAAADSLPY